MEIFTHKDCQRLKILPNVGSNIFPMQKHLAKFWEIYFIFLPKLPNPSNLVTLSEKHKQIEWREMNSAYIMQREKHSNRVREIVKNVGLCFNDQLSEDRQEGSQWPAGEGEQLCLLPMQIRR